MKSKIIDNKVLEHISPNYKYMHEDPSNLSLSFYDKMRFSSSFKYRSEEYLSYSCYKVISNISLEYLFRNYD